MIDPKVIQAIFDAPIVEGGWRSALNAMACEFDAQVPLLMLRNPYEQDPGSMVVPGLSDEEADRWFWALASDPEFPETFARVEPGNAWVIGVDDECREATPMGAWAARMSYPEAMVGVVWREASQGGLLVLMRERGRFPEDELARFRQLLPYVAKALEFQRHLEWAHFERDSARAVLDQLGVGVVLTSPTGDIVHTNRMALAMLEERDGISVVADTLTCEDTEVQMELQRIQEASVEAAFGNTPYPGGSVSIPRLNGRSAIEASVAPISLGASPIWNRSRPAAITFLTDPETLPQLAQQRLARLYRLTPSEGQLAAHLARGGSIESAALEFGRSRDTLRKHLQSTFEKTGTHRQAELVALLLRGRL